jgi:hypothetical protein
MQQIQIPARVIQMLKRLSITQWLARLAVLYISFSRHKSMALSRCKVQEEVHVYVHRFTVLQSKCMLVQSVPPPPSGAGHHCTILKELDKNARETETWCFAATC